MSISVFTTGGTIDKVYFDANSSFEVGDSVMQELLKQARSEVAVSVTPLMAKDSLELTDLDRQTIRDAVAACADDQIVITHGTDTMTDTAAVLADINGKTIVLTGSFSPARFALTDAVFNVGLAFGAVQSKPAGVYIAMSGQVFAASTVYKDRQNQRFAPREES